MAVIKQLYNKPLLEDGNPNKLPVYPISVAEAVYDKYNTDLQTLIDEGYKYLGIATPSWPVTAPHPTQNVFYIAGTAGTYVQFNNQVVPNTDLGIFKYTNDHWSYESISLPIGHAIVNVASRQDGTIDFVDLEGNIITVDLNHTHRLADLIDDSTHRTVTDAEKALWNAGGSSARVQYGTTEYWNSKTGFVPAAGEVIVYSDYSTVEVGGQTKNVPGIKIGSGNAYVQDLAFVTQGVESDLDDHINNTSVHIQSGERDFWNNKINVTDGHEVIDESLIFNRN